MYQEHNIPVDYNMGIRIDLVDKEQYQLNPKPFQNIPQTNDQDASKQDEEQTDKLLEDLKQKLINVRDKFLLSDKQNLPEHLFFEKPKPTESIKKESSRPKLMKRESSMSVKQEPLVYTGPKPENQTMRERGVKQIEDTF